MNNILEYQCKSAFEKIQHKENAKVLIVSNEIDLYRDVLIDLDVEAKNISSISVSNFDFFIDESLLDNSFDLIIGNPPNTRQEKIKDLKPIVSEYQSFYNTADLNVYYFERAFYILKKYAIVSFLTPSKYTKAKYAKRCREFLLGNMNIVEYIDFVETSIILLQKSKELNSSFDYCRVEKQDIALKEYISKHQYNYLQNDLDRDMFVFLSSKVLDIKIKIEKNPLEYINENSSKYITALKNSKVLTFYKESIKYKNKLEILPIPKISKEAQKPFEILVDYIIFAKEQEMNLEASLFESVIDGLVYDLYFEEEMKKGNCFISDEVTRVIGEFDSSKIGDLYKVFKDNKTIQRGLIYSRIISVVEVINGGDK